MVDIQFATAKIRRGKKKRRRKKPQGKNIMSASTTQGGHNYQMLEYKCPQGCIRCTICRICMLLQDALAVKIWMDLHKGLWSYGDFKLRGTGFPHIFSAP